MSLGNSGYREGVLECGSGLSSLLGTVSSGILASMREKYSDNTSVGKCSFSRRVAEHAARAAASCGGSGLYGPISCVS